MYDCPLTKYVRKCFVSDLVQWRLKVLSFSAKCQKTRLKTSFSPNPAWLDCVKLIKFSTKELGVWGSPACGPRCVGTPLPGLGTPASLVKALCKTSASLVKTFCKTCEALCKLCEWWLPLQSWDPWSGTAGLGTPDLGTPSWGTLVWGTPGLGI